MIDIGVNLTNSRFAQDLEQVLERARQAGINTMLVTGTSIESSRQALALCEKIDFPLYSTAGIHPHDAEQVDENFIDKLTQLAQSAFIKAIGECGLDFNRNFSSQESQIRIFEAQIALAAQLKMPLFLHQRDAFNQWFSLLKPYFNTVPAMISHCFTGDKKQLLQCLDAGMYIGITGWVCDERRGKALQDIVKYIPLERLMIETDAPYLLPRNIVEKPKNRRNEPCYLPYIVKILAEKTQYSAQDIIYYSEQNARRVFQLTSSIER